MTIIPLPVIRLMFETVMRPEVYRLGSTCT
jgi:hypothetical protein